MHLPFQNHMYATGSSLRSAPLTICLHVVAPQDADHDCARVRGRSLNRRPSPTTTFSGKAIYCVVLCVGINSLLHRIISGVSCVLLRLHCIVLQQASPQTRGHPTTSYRQHEPPALPTGMGSLDAKYFIVADPETADQAQRPGIHETCPGGSLTPICPMHGCLNPTAISKTKKTKKKQVMICWRQSNSFKHSWTSRDECWLQIPCGAHDESRLQPVCV